MNSLIVLCGIQCSGKSSWTEKFITYFETNYALISSDKLRKEYPNLNNGKIFNKVYQMMNEELSAGNNVIIDATNITIKARKQIFNNLKVSCKKHCIIFNTPIEICRERLIKRNADVNSHFVPLDVLEKYYHAFQIPFYEEGWDYIQMVSTPEYDSAQDFLHELDDKAKTFNQCNKHHTQLLGQHMKTVGNYLDGRCDDEILTEAGYYHDVGKLYTQTYKPDDPNAHYYDHANVGTYELMCKSGIYNYNKNDEYEYDLSNTLEWLFYINYHMILHNVTTDKSIKKWKDIFGEQKYNNLKLFMEADFYRPKLDDDEMKEKFELEKSIINFFKMFADGNQNNLIDLNTGTMSGIRTIYYWEQLECYNKIAPLIDLVKAKCKNISDNDLYSSNGLVAKLYRHQLNYNKIKNRKFDYIMRDVYPNMFVEDGSIDLDALAEDGLKPGGVIVYRQGANPPKLESIYNVNVVIELDKLCDEIFDEMKNITEQFIDKHMEK